MMIKIKIIITVPFLGCGIYGQVIKMMICIGYLLISECKCSVIDIEHYLTIQQHLVLH